MRLVDRMLFRRPIAVGIVTLVLAGIAAISFLWRALGKENDAAGIAASAEEPPYSNEKEPTHPASWGYTGETGPARWGDLSPEFAACKDGVSQSPIDLSGDTETKPHDLAFRYTPTPLDVVNNGHTIQVSYVPGSTLAADGKQYALLQFHFHRASEHTVDGMPADMELHLVHQGADGSLAVVGIFLTEGQRNEALQKVWDNMPTQKGEKRLVEGNTVDATDLLPADLAYFSYVGSLTTPPCTEDVSWFVLREPVEASAEQLAQFAALYADNARPTQPLNGRSLFFSEDSG